MVHIPDAYSDIGSEMKVLALAIMWSMLSVCFAAEPAFIAGELKYLPVLNSELDKYWPEAPWRSVFAAQVRQESCISLKHSICWTPYAELKTSREYGFGLGQITVTKSFDNFKEAKKLDSSLKDWVWENRYNAEYQLRTLVLMDKFAWGKFFWASDSYERMAFTFAGYNGGIGGVLSDRAVCRTISLCRPERWFGNVELTSKKAKVAASGYGLSFFQINRNYVRNNMGPYRDRYYSYFKEIKDVR